MAEQLQGVTPHIIVDDASSAIGFYAKAFGATEVMRMPANDGKRLLHAQIVVNGMQVFLMDHFPEYASEHGNINLAPPKALGGSSLALHLEVQNCDEAVKRAADAGARVTMAPWDAFWGARYAQVLDPFGHVWSFAHPLPPKQN